MERFEEEHSDEEWAEVLGYLPEGGETTREAWSTHVVRWPCGCRWTQELADRHSDVVVLCPAHDVEVDTGIEPGDAHYYPHS